MTCSTVSIHSSARVAVVKGSQIPYGAVIAASILWKIFTKNIPGPIGWSMGVIVDSAFDWYLVLHIAAMYAISCYTGPHYNGQRLHMARLNSIPHLLFSSSYNCLLDFSFSHNHFLIAEKYMGGRDNSTFVYNVRIFTNDMSSFVTLCKVIFTTRLS